MKNFNTPPRLNNISDDEESIGMDDEENTGMDDVEVIFDDLENEEELFNEENDLEIEDEESEDNALVKQATVIYTNHNDSVFCVAYAPNSEMVATGGEDDKAYIWDAITGETKFECKGHEDSVTCISFTHDGAYLATGDLKGHLQVWKVSTLTKVWEFDTNEDLNFMFCHSSSNILFAGTTEGTLWMWLIPQGIMKPLPNSGVSAECGTLMKDGKRMCVGYFDGSIKMIDLKTSQTLHTFQNHSQQVTCIAAHEDNHLIMSGGIDGKAVIINSVSGKEIANFHCIIENNSVNEAEEQQYNNTVEVVSFCPSIGNLAITATLSGLITIWDIPSKSYRHHIIQGCATSSICWYPHESYFFAGGIDGKLRLYDARSGDQKAKLIGHMDSILNCDINRENNRVVTCGDDSTARIFSIEELVS